MTISMIMHGNTEVLTTGLVIPSGNQNFTSSGIDPVVVNKLIIDTRIEILYLRAFRLKKTHK